MKTKQQAIQEAYINLLGEKMYNENKSVINFNDGTIKFKVGLKLPNNGVGFHFIATFSDHSIVIANDLIGIENNNGWIKIESEEDLPKENGTYFTKTRHDDRIRIEIIACENLDKSDLEWYKNHYTHYQPIEKPKLPIY